MLAELLYSLQNGYAPLHLAAREGHTTCVERLLSTPGIDVNIRNDVSCYMLFTYMFVWSAHEGTGRFSGKL